ncbi:MULTISPECIES: molecular chaperone HtpG [Helicobacter]|uniref:Chaperone protein HtpG n=5 Tax=Helicobacter typhlonius TaxID=76936 RepID=A0A099UHM5_9HELI|nr:MULTISPECIES: molecular chaperone HtpG [Helicobacter]TLD78000.1 molecular chaperone HtpG [Helicobacter typhlonius]TLD87969.1 molecular chaperone HtpG [Helicobacter sp. MIT 03-1616]CUU39987.1 Chaperone protein HtpG [Helicobacter typhlonius]
MATKHQFETEITQLLDLMIHSLYSHKEIFLRELISNASDALDKLSYLTLTQDNLKSLAFDARIDISFDEEKKTITIEDNGVGMNEADMKEHLGIIAKSGTKSFLAQLSGDKKKDSALIGQFGVGFYSAFMVAHRVVVESKKAGEEKAYAWVSEGKGEYELGECIKDTQGTKITLYLREDEAHFASKWEIESIIHKYSEHIAFPIFLHFTESSFEGEGDNRQEKKEDKVSQVNTAKALWKIPKAELKENDYKEFYATLTHDNNEPMRWIHTKVEGNLEYTTLFYIPKKAPFDLYRVDYQSGVKLYVKRVFITDDDKELLPPYLRFVRGVIDSEDLPLNVSREILQQNKILANIKSASTKKILGEIANIAKKDEEYKDFYKEFGKVLKEGLYSDYENKEKILELLRFDSFKVENLSLKAYKDAMSSEQKSIYYILGENKDSLKNAPLLEKFAQKGFDVLLLSDEIDAVVMPMVGEYDKTPLRSINSKEALEELGEDSIPEEIQKAFEGVVKGFKDALGGQIAEVKLSTLGEAPLTLIKEDSNPMMANLMAQMGQKMPESKPTIELNITHSIFEKLKNAQEDKIKQSALLLFGAAVVLEGGALENAKTFNAQLNDLILRSL